MDLAALALSVITFVLQCLVIFAVSTLLFDVLHYLLHRWKRSRFRILRLFSTWHWVHHRFLTLEMKVDPAYQWKNVWFHIIPEYATSILGTLPFLLIFPLEAVATVIVVRTIFFVVTFFQEGMDIHHMTMDRIDGRQNLLWVGPDYHAMHHIYPNNYFSSFFNILDLVMGKSCQIAGRRVLVTGASGAFGSAMIALLEREGAIIETAKSGVDFRPGDISGMRDKLQRADILLLAHGAKSEGCMEANCTSFVSLIDTFREMGRGRLTPPEVWAVGSEAELHGDLGMASMRDYAASKRAFARYARGYYNSPDLFYRHIVPSAFTSRMGRGPISAKTAARIALFFIKRNFRYVPVTVTTLAYFNYFRFLLQPAPETARQNGAAVADAPKPTQI